MPNAIIRLHRACDSEEPSEYDDGLNRMTSAKLGEDSHGSEVDSLGFEDNCNLAFFQASLFATLMEDAITEIRLLDECNHELRILKTMTDMNILLRNKYNVTRQTDPDELADIDHKNLECDKYKLNKLVADRNLANSILVSTYLDLALNKRFETVIKYNKSIYDTDAYRACLAEETMNNKSKRREVGKQVRLQRNHIKSVTYDTDQTIEDLKGRLEDALLVSEAKSRYMDYWQVARTEQNTQTIFDKEAGPSKVIKYFRQRHDHEARVHSEIELLTNIRINETLEKVEKWMNKYDKDMENIDLRIQLKKNDFNSQTSTREQMELLETLQKVEGWMNKYDHDMENIDLKIQIQKNEYNTQVEQREGLQHLYDKHTKEMEDWIKFTTDREAERLYRLKMNTAANVVQAWWRGLLVRLQLGPYKQDKKKAGKDDKKKK